MATVNFHIWQASSGELLSQKVLPIPAEFFHFDLSPDWQWLAVGRENGMPELWDVAAGERRLTFLGHDASISGVSFTADGSQLVTADFEGQVQIWEMSAIQEGAAAQLSLTFASPNEKPLTRAFFSSDGSHLALVWDTVVEIWDLSDTAQPQFTLASHDDAVRYVDFTPDDTKVATASVDNTAKVWDLTKGEELFAFSDHQDVVFRLAFSPDGRFLTTVSNDGTARIWHIASRSS